MGEILGGTWGGVQVWNIDRYLVDCDVTCELWHSGLSGIYGRGSSDERCEGSVYT